MKLLVSTNPPLLPKSTYAYPSPSASGHCALLFPYGHLRVTFTQVCWSLTDLRSCNMYEGREKKSKACKASHGLPCPLMDVPCRVIFLLTTCSNICSYIRRWQERRRDFSKGYAWLHRSSCFCGLVIQRMLNILWTRSVREDSTRPSLAVIQLHNSRGRKFTPLSVD